MADYLLKEDGDQLLQETGDGILVAVTGGGGRTTFNTRAWPLGTEIGMGWRMECRPPRARVVLEARA